MTLVEHRLAVQDELIITGGLSRSQAVDVEQCLWSYGEAGYIARCVYAVGPGLETLKADHRRFAIFGGTVPATTAPVSAVVQELEEGLITIQEATKKVMELVGGDFLSCKRCGVTCEFTQKQLRSADEPMTVFLTCPSCGWNEKF
jgi:hypothetical protein